MQNTDEALTPTGTKTGGGARIPETAADRIIDGSRDLWESFHRHPFVRGIADGSLDPAKFEFYMIQDYLYLLEYARVFSVGTAKSADPETMNFLASYISAILSGEMDIHRDYMKLLGISRERAETTPMDLDNLSYTSYMLRIAYEGGPAEVFAAVLPCALSYEVIARKMVEENPACLEHPFYGRWISGYASEDYHRENEDMLRAANRLFDRCTPEELTRLTQIGRNCSLYEGRFWDMGWTMGGRL